MGQEYAQQINAQLPIVQDPELNRYINVLGDQIARLTSRADLDWRFYIVDSKEVNAFAVPGGFIYINRGLIERTDRMDELAGVLGHEIGHVVRRHSIQQMEKAQGANIGVTLACVLTSVCNSQIAGPRSTSPAAPCSRGSAGRTSSRRTMRAVNNVVRAGISPQGIVTMFQKLIAERRSRPGWCGGLVPDSPARRRSNSGSSGPINQIPPATLSRLGTDTRNFHTFKSRLQSLPPSPPPRQVQ